MRKTASDGRDATVKEWARTLELALEREVRELDEPTSDRFLTWWLDLNDALERVFSALPVDESDPVGSFLKPMMQAAEIGSFRQWIESKAQESIDSLSTADSRGFIMLQLLREAHQNDPLETHRLVRNLSLKRFLEGCQKTEAHLEAAASSEGEPCAEKLRYAADVMSRKLVEPLIEVTWRLNRIRTMRPSDAKAPSLGRMAQDLERAKDLAPLLEDDPVMLRNAVMHDYWSYDPRTRTVTWHDRRKPQRTENLPALYRIICRMFILFGPTVFLVGEAFTFCDLVRVIPSLEDLQGLETGGHVGR